MWWKLTGLFLITAVLVFSVIPIRTQAIMYDPLREPPPTRDFSISGTIANMYLTPATPILVGVIVAASAFAALKIIRGDW